jgi:hypothetical protein
MLAILIARERPLLNLPADVFAIYRSRNQLEKLNQHAFWFDCIYLNLFYQAMISFNQIHNADPWASHACSYSSFVPDMPPQKPKPPRALPQPNLSVLWKD